MAVLVDSFRRPKAAVWTLVIIPLFAVGDWLAAGPQSAMLLAAGWPMDRMATVQSIAVTAQLITAVAAGAAVTRYGPGRVALASSVLGVAAVAGALPLAIGHGPVVPTAAMMILLSITYGTKLTVVYAVTMRLARESHAATDYAVPTAVEGITVTLVSSSAVGVAGHFGFAFVIGPALLLAVLGAAVAPAWIRRTAQSPVAGGVFPVRARWRWARCRQAGEQ